MNFVFSWQEQYLTRSLRSLVLLFLPLIFTRSYLLIDIYSPPCNILYIQENEIME